MADPLVVPDPERFRLAAQAGPTSHRRGSARVGVTGTFRGLEDSRIRSSILAISSLGSTTLAFVVSVSERLTSGWSGLLLLSDGFAGYLGPGLQASGHAHHAVQVIWSFGRPVEVALDGSSRAVTAAIVPANSHHGFNAHPDPLLLLFVEPHSQRGRVLDTLARQLNGAELSHRVASPGLLPAVEGVAVVEAWCDSFLDALVADLIDSRARSQAVSLRVEVEETLDYIDRNLRGVPRLKEAATEVGISSSRLTHLFTAQVGMPFRRFVLWSRIKTATEEVKQGRSMTDAAASAGFSDSAHFSRVFHDMFGLAPSAVLPIVEIVGNLGPPR